MGWVFLMAFYKKISREHWSYWYRVRRNFWWGEIVATNFTMELCCSCFVPLQDLRPSRFCMGHGKCRKSYQCEWRLWEIIKMIILKASKQETLWWNACVDIIMKATAWLHSNSLMKTSRKSVQRLWKVWKLFECICLKSGFSSICLLCCLKYCYFFKIYILLFLFPSAFFFFRTPRSSFLCLIVSSSLTTSPSLWLSDPTHSIESQLKTMKILLKQWKVALGSYNKIDSHHTILVLCVYFLWYLCFPSLNTLYCYTFLPFFS